jgi:opacity protein-like surface antigen
MKKFLAAAAAATLLAGGAIAQTATEPAEETAAGWEAGQWTENLAHMQSLVSNELARMGIDADVEDMTIRQLNELALVIDDDGLTEQERIDQVRAIIEN